MNYLSFDTSSSVGSVAVGHFSEPEVPADAEPPAPEVAAGAGSEAGAGATDEGAPPPRTLRVLARGFLTERAQHSSGLLPLIRDVVDEAGIELRDLLGVAVGSGPGSFTGVRVAAATAKGLVRALRLSLHPVSSLAAGAASVGVRMQGALDPSSEFQLAGLPKEDLARPRYVLFDAREDRIYAACYRIAGGRTETLVSPHAARLAALLEEDIPDGTLFAGSGALRHAEAIRAKGFPVLPLPAGLPTAEGVLRVLASDPGAFRAEHPGRWEPDYLRDSKARPAARQGKE